jgi:hypothetical protein
VVFFLDHRPYWRCLVSHVRVLGRFLYHFTRAFLTSAGHYGSYSALWAFDLATGLVILGTQLRGTRRTEKCDRHGTTSLKMRLGRRAST